MWDGGTTFFNNSATSGGALYAISDLRVSFAGDTVFENNSAIFHGEIDGSAAGGALIAKDSDITWNGRVAFTNNTASYMGGAVLMQNSSALFEGQATFLENFAGRFGGAVLVEVDSIVAWNGVVRFANNSAISEGGALRVSNSTMDYNNKTIFIGNMAFAGGAASLDSGARASWNDETMFANNRASDDRDLIAAGGAISVEGGANASWSGQMAFIDNSASLFGGALHVTNSSSVHWTSSTTFVRNTAFEGGAIFVNDGSYVGWNQNTEFMSNHAQGDGGAIGSFATAANYNSVDSNMSVAGATMFTKNTCGGSGGGIAMLEALSVDCKAADVTFGQNSAEVAGGAVFVSGSGIGPEFHNINFMSNSAQTGGAVYATGSDGAKKSADDPQAPNATRIDGCRFVGNRASATGGAIESAAGDDAIINTLFERNMAGVRGALRLAGTAYLQNCSFLENVSDLDGGPAVSNIGCLSNSSDNIFAGNVFNCASATFENVSSLYRLHMFPVSQWRCYVFRVGDCVSCWGFTSGRSTYPRHLVKIELACCMHERRSQLVGRCFCSAKVCRSHEHAPLRHFRRTLRRDYRARCEQFMLAAYVGRLLALNKKPHLFKCALDLSHQSSSVHDVYDTAFGGCDTTCEGCSFDDPFRFVQRQWNTPPAPAATPRSNKLTSTTATGAPP